jgi:hypothetical protein
VYPQVKDRNSVSYPSYLFRSSEVNLPLLNRRSFLKSEILQYGSPEDTSRPGGPLAFVNFSSNTSTFSLLADNATVLALIPKINASCAVHHLLATAIMTPTPYTVSSTYPAPEQAVQYYRGSSAVLTLEGYNNSAVYTSNTSLSASPLPSGADTTLLACLNGTISSDIPLYTQKGFTGSEIVGIGVGVFVALFILGQLLFGCKCGLVPLRWLAECLFRGWDSLWKYLGNARHSSWRAYLRDLLRRRFRGARARPDGALDADKSSYFLGSLPSIHITAPKRSHHPGPSSVSMQPLMHLDSPSPPYPGSRSPSPVLYLPPPPYHDASSLPAPSARYDGSRSPSPSKYLVGYDV